MGQRASEVWPVTVRNGGYGMIWSPPSTEVAETAEPELVEVEQVAGPTPTNDTATTIVDVDGGVSMLGRWLIHILMRITVRRRKP
jgi:hypothetical protein